MDDADLEEIRAKRMAEMGAMRGGGGAGGSQDQMAKQQEAVQRQQDAKNMMLSQVLDQAARARLNTLSLTNPDRAKMVENLVLQSAQRGQLGGKIGEEELKNLLQQVSNQTSKKTTVKFDRRRNNLDSDDEDY